MQTPSAHKTHRIATEFPQQVIELGEQFDGKSLKPWLVLGALSPPPAMLELRHRLNPMAPLVFFNRSEL